MKHILILLTSGLLISCGAQNTIVVNTAPLEEQKLSAVSIDDFKVLKGNDWQGRLTYLNYGSDERSTIPVNLEVSINSDQALIYKMIFPDEPHANSESSLSISDGGAKLDGQKITKRFMNEDGETVIVTKSKGYDDNREVTIRTTYSISENEFKMKKDVQFDTGEAFINRNEFAFNR